MWVLFTDDGSPRWFGPSPVAGAELIEGVDQPTLLACRRVNGEWALRDPVEVIPPTADEIAADLEAVYQAALVARDDAIDAAVTTSAAYRSFIRGGMTLTAYREAAAEIEDQFPIPSR